MSYWWFWSRYGSENIWQNFGQFVPFPVGVTQRSSRGQNLKMLEMTFHVYQITPEVIRTTKIYSLLCVGCMVREILTKGHPKVKWGQIFKTSDSHEWHIKLFLSACTFQKYIPLSYLSFHFWNKPIYLNSDHDCSGKSTQVQNRDYWLQEINNPHNSVNHLNWFCIAYDYTHQIWIWYCFAFSSYEISETLNAYMSKLVLWHLSTSSTTVFKSKLPWITKDLIKMINKKRRRYKQYMKKKDPTK